jgi:hypothetical protein
MYQQSSRAGIARHILRLLLRVTRRLLRLLLRRPVIDILMLILVLWIIASLVGRFNRPRPVLYEPPTLFEGR